MAEQKLGHVRFRPEHFRLGSLALSPLVPAIDRPLLMTNGTHDILCPPVLAPSGLGARRMAELSPSITTHEFPDIGHADLLECPEEAVQIVASFFEAALSEVGKAR